MVGDGIRLNKVPLQKSIEKTKQLLAVPKHSLSCFLFFFVPNSSHFVCLFVCLLPELLFQCVRPW